MSNEDLFEPMRKRLVAEVAAQLMVLGAQMGRRVLTERVTQVMERVPRHAFVPAEVQPLAYMNTPLPIGCGKTISQPFIVWLMTELLELEPTHRVLEIGTGLGYQAAILAELAGEVYSVELIPELSAQASRRLARLGYRGIHLRVGNGRLGWPEHAPFDRIIVTTAPDLIPPPLLQQLKPGGKMMIPAGIPDQQQLLLVERGEDGKTTTKEILAVRFSEMEEDAGPGGTS
jgi:protein-L-isoaspartate(D-aspartate) O-methyltransferase